MTPETRKPIKRKSWITPFSARKLKQRKWQKILRGLLVERDGPLCKRCSGTWGVAMHHILPVGKGGKDTLENVLLLCWYCHRGVHDHLVNDWADWIDVLKETA